MNEHYFTSKAQWSGGLNGSGKLAIGNLESAISVPAIMNGPGRGTNPEELVVGSASTCYLITLAAILERHGVAVARLELQSEGVFSPFPNLKFLRLVHRPRLVLGEGAGAEDKKKVAEAFERAEKACLISSALKGNVEISVEGTILEKEIA